MRRLVAYHHGTIYSSNRQVPHPLKHTYIHRFEGFDLATNTRSIYNTHQQHVIYNYVHTDLSREGLLQSVECQFSTVPVGVTCINYNTEPILPDIFPAGGEHTERQMNNQPFQTTSSARSYKHSLTILVTMIYVIHRN